MRALTGRELRFLFLAIITSREVIMIALIFKMAAARFLDVFKEETSKMKENAVALIIT